MKEHKIWAGSKVSIIERLDGSFKMSVEKDRKLHIGTSTAILEATLYKEDGVFIKEASYIFEALGSDNNPITDVCADDFKCAVDFFFKSILHTEYYVKSIPPSSTLFPKDNKLFRFEQAV